MATCYQCGKLGANYRRNVTTGTSSGNWVSNRSYGSSNRNYYGLRTVCEKCAARIDKNGYLMSSLILIIIAIGLVWYNWIRI